MPEKAIAAILDRFAASPCSWLSTVRPDGRPHATPVWHAWHGERIYVVTTERAVKTANIASNPEVVITHPDPMEVIIIEGTARLDAALPPEANALFQAKYDWDAANDADYRIVVEITPRKLMAWGGAGSKMRYRW